ncbi:MAG: MFS transporter [Chloroflexi bacterium]|nr:MFS transporter [Chloroflexota bacterium]
MGSSVNIALPSIGRDLGMDAINLGWVATSYALAAAMLLVPFGRIADIYGRKKVFIYGTAIFSACSFLCAVATASFALIAFRFLQGIGAAMIFGTGLAILTSVFPPGDRGRVLGINVAAVYSGLSLGPFLGGLMTDALGWRSIFALNVILGTLVVSFTVWKLRGEWAGARGERFDLIGSAIYSLVLVAAMYGFSLLPSPNAFVFIVVGVIAFFVFVRWELRTESPVLDIKLFRDNRVFAFSSLAALLNYSATFAVGFLLSLYLQYVKGLSAEGAGIILVSQPVVQAVFSPFTGRLSDRIEPRIIASMGMGATVVGLALLTFLSSDTPFPFIVGSLMLLGLGFALFSSPNMNAVMSSVERRLYGVASATIGTMRLIGQMMSLGISMLVFALFIGRVQITPEYYASFLQSANTIFVIFAVLCFGGIFASLARGKVR